MGYTNLNHIIMVYTLRWETTTEPLADRPAKIVCCRFLILLIEQLREQQTSAHRPVIIIIYSFSLECHWGLCYDYYLEMLLDRCSLCAAVKKRGGAAVHSRDFRGQNSVLQWRNQDTSRQKTV